MIREERRDVLVQTEHVLETIEEFRRARPPGAGLHRARTGLGQSVGYRPGRQAGGVPVRAVAGHPVARIAGAAAEWSDGGRQIDRPIRDHGPARSRLDRQVAHRIILPGAARGAASPSTRGTRIIIRDTP